MVWRCGIPCLDCGPCHPVAPGFARPTTAAATPGKPLPSNYRAGITQETADRWTVLPEAPMLKEIEQLPLPYWVALLVALALVARTALARWWRYRHAELALAFQRELLEHGFPIADVARLTRRNRSQPPAVAGPP